MIEKTVYKEDIEEELRRIREELGDIERKIRKGQLHDVLRTLEEVIDDVDMLIDDIERYDPWDDIDDEDVAYVCYNWGCRCPDG
jgi:hypothetical protein